MMKALHLSSALAVFFLIHGRAGAMKIEVLSSKHLDKLFKFETDNCEWFESFIEPRDNFFYSRLGFESHLNEFISAYKNGTLYPGIVTLDGQIVGRANIRICEETSESASIGYRVAREYSGKGIATFGVNELVNIAFHDLGLKKLRAIVLENNPASIKVLERCDFKLVGFTGEACKIKGKEYRCMEFIRANV